ncbi:MAG: hypothetical protein WAO02_01990 [Verrucomicrobiia bacterium]
MPHESKIYLPAWGRIMVCGERLFAGPHPSGGIIQLLAQIVCLGGFNGGVLVYLTNLHHFRRLDAKLYHADVDDR